jgi:hypothetical protein
MERALHRRYLDYREMFVYFGRKIAILTAEEFTQADEELAALSAKGKNLDRKDENRKEELEALLFRS